MRENVAGSGEAVWEQVDAVEDCGFGAVVEIFKQDPAGADLDLRAAAIV